MTSNKYLIPEKSKILETRLRQLFTELDSLSNFSTEEALLIEANKALTLFYKDISEPLFSYQDIIAGDLPDMDLYNQAFNTISNDLSSVFTELENIETLSVSNFNYALTEFNRLIARLKRISSKIEDYSLYSINPTKDAIFFKDSFSNLSKIDSQSSFLNSLECNISQEEGIVTLPIIESQNSRFEIKGIIINRNSNGNKGNNLEINTNEERVELHDDEFKMLDNNSDTWFEYEQVFTVDSETGFKLVLDITLDLGEEKIVNHIRINPNNFGTKNSIKIDAIETSLDGEVFISIKDDIPETDFNELDRDREFILAPSTSRYSGQGFYTFLPRKIRYIHFTFSQTEPYLINIIENVVVDPYISIAGTVALVDASSRSMTSQQAATSLLGRTPQFNPISAVQDLTTIRTIPITRKQKKQALRYAIGIRDIEISGLLFENVGEVISKSFDLEDEVSRLIFESSQVPVDYSNLVSIDHFISTDNGQSWHQIKPMNFIDNSEFGKKVPQLLIFNGIEDSSIDTASEVRSIRWKGVLSRDDEAFENSVMFGRNVIERAVELFTVSIQESTELELKNVPIVDGEHLVKVTNPLFGSCGDENIGYIIISNGFQETYPMPFSFKNWPLEKTIAESAPFMVYDTAEVDINDWVIVKVNGVAWGIVGEWGETGTEKEVMFDLVNQRLTFDSDHIPSDGAIISISLASERLYPSLLSEDYIAALDNETTSDKTDIIIKGYSDGQVMNEYLPRGERRIQLAKKNLTDITGIEEEFEIVNQKIYNNGHSELKNAGDWSIDMDNGILYLYTATPDDSDIMVSYGYRDIRQLDESQWELILPGVTV